MTMPPAPSALMRAGHTLGRGAMDPVDQLAFVVGLEVLEHHAERRRQFVEAGFDVGQGGAAVALGLAGAQEVQVGAVEDEDGHELPSSGAPDEARSARAAWMRSRIPRRKATAACSGWCRRMRR